MTGQTDDGEEGTDTIRISYSPDVAMESGLVLSLTASMAGTSVEVEASLWLAPEASPDEVVVGPSDSDGELEEIWASLDSGETPGLFVGSFTVDEAAPISFELRARVTEGEDVGTTPPGPFSVIEAPSLQDWSELALLAAEAADVLEANDPDLDPLGARDAVVEMLLASPGVLSVGTADDGGTGIWWIAEPGVPFVMENNSATNLGGGGTSTLPRTRWPSAGVGAPRGWTPSNRGPSGRGWRAVERGGVSVTGNSRAILVSPFSSSMFNDATPAVNNLFESMDCPFVDISPAFDSSGGLLTLSQQFDRGMVSIWTHGDTFFGGAFLPSQWGWSGPEGGQMAYGGTSAFDSAWITWRTPYCPVPGRSVTLTFKWQVATWITPNCDSGEPPNWFTVRIDRAGVDEDNQNLWLVHWADVCPLLSSVPGWYVTGWQEASVTFTAPATSAPDLETLAVSAGGYYAKGWYGLIDDIKVE